MMESFRGAWRDEEVDSTCVKYHLAALPTSDFPAG